MAFLVIIFLYVSIGFLAAAGSVCISRKLFSLKAEQIFFALFLIAIAGFYLAFGLLRAGRRVATRNQRCDCIHCVWPPWCSTANGAHHWVPSAWCLGLASRDSCSWRRQSVRRPAGNRTPTGLRRLLWDLRLVHGRVFLLAAESMVCCLV
jgi:hypothetical protein